MSKGALRMSWGYRTNRPRHLHYIVLDIYSQRSVPQSQFYIHETASCPSLAIHAVKRLVDLHDIQHLKLHIPSRKVLRIVCCCFKRVHKVKADRSARWLQSGVCVFIVISRGRSKPQSTRLDSAQVE